MNEKAEQLWKTVLANDILVLPTDEERAALNGRMTDIATRLLTWEGSDGQVEMPTVGDVCNLAADIARFNTRSVMAGLLDGGAPDPILTLDLS